jgi:hypothetical protein
MRETVLDTYSGEGPLNTSAEDYPGFKHIYFKVCEGAYGLLNGSTFDREVTQQIALESKEFGMDTIGIYHYPRRHDEIHWLRQAEEYMRQCDILDNLGVQVNYDVQDVERRNIVNLNDKYPQAHGAHLYEMYRYISERTQRPFLLYSDPHTYIECFRWYGYEWQDELPWICAQYYTRYYDEAIWNEAVAELRNPDTYPANRAPVMWQVTDKYPAEDWFPQSQEADVNVWLVDWRQLLGMPAPVAKKTPWFKRALARIRRGRERM